MFSCELISDRTIWNSILKEHGITDVYYQYDYAFPMAVHMNARPVLVHYYDGTGGFVYVLLISDISEDSKFKGILEPGKYFDAETPYGYGGPYYYGYCSIEKDLCLKTIRGSLREEGIISQFVRYYPLIFDEKKSTVIVDKYGTYKSTIAMDTANEEIVRGNLDSQYRRKIRKATEAGVKIRYDSGENIREFERLYNMTMKMHDAEDMYYFKEDYYSYLIHHFRDNMIIFYAEYESKILGASIFLFNEEYMHFHLGGRDINAPNIPFENLLMVEAALWGAGKGKKMLHIGGGLSDEDSLFQYKKKFNRSGALPFYIGRMVVDRERYDYLMTKREENDPSFDKNNNYYIQYRF